MGKVEQQKNVPQNILLKKFKKHFLNQKFYKNFKVNSDILNLLKNIKLNLIYCFIALPELQYIEF